MNRREAIKSAGVLGSLMIYSCYHKDIQPKVVFPKDCLCSANCDLNLSLDNQFNNHTTSIQITVQERSEHPLISVDRPWEKARINSTVVLRVKNKWQMWYEASDEAGLLDNFSTYLCYAESTDGITWIKPFLNKVTYGNNTNNNIVISGLEIGGLHGINVFYDRSALENSRYKLTFIQPNAAAFSWVYGMSSADGINFTNPVLLLKANSDTQSASFFDKGKYKLFVRLWDGGSPGIGRRTIGYSENTNFGKTCFPMPIEILAFDRYMDRDLYNSAICKIRDDLYLMFPSVLYSSSDTTVPYLATSSDGLNFNIRDEEFLPLGKSFDSKGIYICPGAIPGEKENEYIIFYLGTSVLHGSDPSIQSNLGAGAIGWFKILIS
ncbi:MAG: hypothetical protein AABY93_00510 [Bacteroidota bacterium]